MAHAVCIFCWSRMASSTPPSRPKIRPTADELSLWHRVAETVQPLQNRPPPPLASARAPGAPKVVAKTAQPSQLASKNPPATKVHPKTPLETGRLVDIDRRTGERFRLGRMAIEATLDLHGMTQERAHGLLRRFLHQAEMRGQRCLLIVTGKGRAGPGSGVLRRAVPLWLNGADLRPIILAVTPAQQYHGGQGALYLLLRRRRER